MDKKVRLTISSEQTDTAGEKSHLDTSAEAEYFFRNGNHFLLYEEISEEGSVPVRNMLKISGHCLEHTKKGAVDSCMVFREGEDHRTEYRTPYGSFLFDLHTHLLRCEITESAVFLELRYALSMNEEPLSECHMTIRAQ